MDNPTDEALIGLAKKGDDTAFRVLMLRHMQAIYNFVRQYAKNDDDGEDIVQDTFFKAWKSLKRFESDRPFRPWLYAIARNTALDFLKKKRAINFSDMDSGEEETPFAETIRDNGPSAAEEFEKREITEEVLASLDDLHPDHKAVLIMHYHEELTFTEIATIIGKPMNTVKSWHRRALSRLQDGLMHRKA